MSGTLRGIVGIVALGAIGLAAFPSVKAWGQVSGTAELKAVQADEKFVNLLLNRNEAAIQHQLGKIARQDHLIALLPVSHGAYLAHLCKTITKINNELAPAHLRLINDLNQTSKALARLDALHPIHPNVAIPLARFEMNAQNRFNQEVQTSQGILNRPPATPCVPSGPNGSMSGMTTMTTMVMPSTGTHEARSNAMASHVSHASESAARRVVKLKHPKE